MTQVFIHLLWRLKPLTYLICFESKHRSPPLLQTHVHRNFRANSRGWSYMQRRLSWNEPYMQHSFEQDPDWFLYEIHGGSTRAVLCICSSESPRLSRAGFRCISALACYLPWYWCLKPWNFYLHIQCYGTLLRELASWRSWCQCKCCPEQSPLPCRTF